MALRMDINSLLNHPLEVATSGQLLTDTEIINLVSQEEEEEEEEAGNPVLAINTNTAIQYAKDLQRFVLEKVENDEKARLFSSQLEKIHAALISQQTKKAKQTNIQDYFSK
ncbi:uncharacterized protein SRS1_10533 [Sporisorium reilianum f. sp. reilianum]|uniref:Uncharacterized protein n=1 Tax=Sporisorium reilianum f. sp. reilianum TaxID=72559 RepID=A0A2N8UHT6_9BASI|nr:uncharacterized protein SRS1_10533 [Sporisorium reilianum f. sp. reilianum]